VENRATGEDPYLIRRTDGEPFGMAGLWEAWHGKNGATLETCTVIVTDANGLVRELHDRMPAILPREDYEAWLDPANKDTTDLWKMLRPADPAPLGSAASLAQRQQPRERLSRSPRFGRCDVASGSRREPPTTLRSAP
jgi:putative SOS response-associated peptidase YedK